jgi:hypothetical protein
VERDAAVIDRTRARRTKAEIADDKAAIGQEYDDARADGARNVTRSSNPDCREEQFDNRLGNDVLKQQIERRLIGGCYRLK